MKVHRIELPKIGLVNRLLSFLRKSGATHETKVGRPVKSRAFKPISPMYQTLQSPFDVRLNNEIILKSRHDYIR